MLAGRPAVDAEAEARRQSAERHLSQGRLDDAANFAERARNRMRRLDDRFGLVQSLVPLMRAQVALGRTAAAQRTSEEVLALAAGGRQELFPILAAAGAAMHRGSVGGALDISEQALQRARELGMQMSEPVVVMAMLQAQAGRPDDALATITSLDHQALQHPFAAAVASLIHTVNHMPDEALQCARPTEAAGASYLDHVIASVAAAGAHAQLGHLDDAEAAATEAVNSATNVGDVPATALATAAYAMVTGRRHPAHDDRATLGEGWATVLSMLR